ncbi:MAG: phosphoribosylformylglycinamidine synthase subunit PurS [Chlamydiae bacterium]|nr:phosphoribosylformylglycinamidine synthase subunit PurS [Chlamydiota bacterium]MBI3277927.1 phosphoribosylformylglycinamidine synthase subunit PurS [Chlamydiota bacterium]
MIKAKIEVTLKKGVSDPQGLTVQHALKTLQYSGIHEVRVGKYVEVFLEAQNPEEAKPKIQSICEKLLVNPIIEQYRYELELC